MAKFVPNADQRKERAIRVHDADPINRMADAVDARRKAARNVSGSKAGSTLGVVGGNGQYAALREAARIVDEAKAAGYSTSAAEGLIGQGEYRASARAAIVNGATASDKPGLPEARIKSDGRRDRRLDRQRRLIGRELDIMKMTPAEIDAAVAVGTIGAGVYDLLADLNNGGVQEASTRPDAVDTGEWFG